MLNREKAKSAISKLIMDQSNMEDIATINLPCVPLKNVWKNQIIGSYDLMFPYLHKDYPTREEVYISIQQSFHQHHKNNKHWGKRSIRTYSHDEQQTQIIPRETANAQGEKVRINSPINKIGYGTTI